MTATTIHSLGNVLPTSLPDTRRPPILGILIAVLGVICLLAGMADGLATMTHGPGAAAQILPRDHPGTLGSSRSEGWQRGLACRGPSPPSGSCVVDASAHHVQAAELASQLPRVLAPMAPSAAVPGCWGRKIDRGTRSESAHLGSLSLCLDPRQTLAAMAEWLHAGRGFRARHTDSDEWIESALFAPTLTRRPVHACGDKQPRKANGLSEEWDARWERMDMAGGERGDSGSSSPCPIYPMDGPVGGPT